MKLLKAIWRHATRRMPNEVANFLKTGSPIIQDNETLQSNYKILFDAAEAGNKRFLVEIFRTYPGYMDKVNENGLTVFHISLMHGHTGLLNLLDEIGSLKDDICDKTDERGNNMAHLVAKSTKERLQKYHLAYILILAGEMMMFQRVEKLMPPKLREAKNKDGQTPFELFRKENMYLIEDGIKWVQNVTIFATLMMTIVVALVVNSKNVTPEHRGTTNFDVFSFGVTFTFSSSSISILVFLYVLIPRQYNHLGLRILLFLMYLNLQSLLTSFIAMIYVVITSLQLKYGKGKPQNSLKSVLHLYFLLGILYFFLFLLLKVFLTNHIGVIFIPFHFYRKKRALLYNY
ncbi:hypothetical protein R6Q59_029668 [Mikania micrantha]